MSEFVQVGHVINNGRNDTEKPKQKLCTRILKIVIAFQVLQIRVRSKKLELIHSY